MKFKVTGTDRVTEEIKLQMELPGKGFAHVEQNLKALGLLDHNLLISIDLIEEKTALQSLMNEWSNWTNGQFYPGQPRKMVLEQIRTKMLEEYKELVKAETEYFESKIYKESLRMEVADCFGLFLDYASKLNITAEDLIKMTDAKLQINLGRTWSKQANGTFKHY